MGPGGQLLLIVSIFVGIFLILGAIGAFLGFLIYTPKGKGMLGEWVMRYYLGKNKAGEKYVINDLIISDSEGHTSQIDHILIYSTGIYVIETKNYGGRLYGSEKDQEWTQVLKYGKIKNKFYNPIKQNATHIYRLNQLINTSAPIKSLVVFIYNDISNIKADNVINASDINNVISKGEKVLDPLEMYKLYNQILDIKNNNTVTIEKHIENVTTTLSDIKENICPRCSGKLVEREGKYGKFYGCENYPKCRFIKK